MEDSRYLPYPIRKLIPVQEKWDLLRPLRSSISSFTYVSSLPFGMRAFHGVSRVRVLGSHDTIDNV
jgi:hypothetical protein